MIIPNMEKIFETTRQIYAYVYQYMNTYIYPQAGPPRGLRFIISPNLWDFPFGFV